MPDTQKKGLVEELLRVNARKAALYAEIEQLTEYTAPQCLIIVAVAQNPGCSQIGLREATGIDRSTTSDVVYRLRTQGVLSVDGSARDARRNTIWLTALGKQAYKKIKSACGEPELVCR